MQNNNRLRTIQKLKRVYSSKDCRMQVIFWKKDLKKHEKNIYITRTIKIIKLKKKKQLQENQYMF